MKTVGNKIALLGDLHIGVNKNSEEFYETSKKWIKYFIGECIKRKVNHVFILGDWHHYRDEISVMTLDVSSELMNMFPKNINVHILTGNHDCYFKDNSEIHSLQMFKGWENVTVYDKLETIKSSGGKTIGVVPWGCEDEKLEKSDYVFGHFEIKNFKMNNYTICSKGVDSSSLVKSGADVYTGHFHKYQSKQYKNGSITYVGSPFQHDFNDVDNENGFHILDTTTGECEFVKNNNDYPKFKYIKVSKLKDLNLDDVSNNYCKLQVDTEVKEAALEKLVIKLNSKNPVNLIVDDITIKKELDSIELDDNIGDINIESSINEFIEKMGEIKHKEDTIERIKEYYSKKS
jgi:DNA repair exonuclease SbcCD nuclease subunit